MGGMGKPGDQQTWVYQAALDAWLAGATAGGSGGSNTTATGQINLTNTKVVDNVPGNGSIGSAPATNWTGSYASQGNPAAIFATAAGFSNTPALITLKLKIDGTVVASSSWFCNTAGIHGTLPAIFFPTQMSAGTHALRLEMSASAGIATGDTNDFGTISVTEFSSSVSIATSLSGTSVVKYHDTTYGPIGLWSLSGTLNDSGSLVQNMVTNGGTARYTSMAPGLRGVMLDGSTILGLTASLPFSAITVMTGALTWEGMLIVEPPSAASTIWTCSGLSGDNNGSENELFGININGNGTILTSWETNVGVNQGPTTTTVVVPFNRLFHLAVSRDASGICKTYIDGALMEVSTTNTMPNTGTVAASSARFNLGAFPQGTFGGILQGTSNVAIASVKVVPRVLTDGEVASDYQRTLGSLYTNTATGNVITPGNGITTTFGSNGSLLVSSSLIAGSPADFPGLIGWYEAQTGSITLDNTGVPSVREWRDLSSASNHIGMVTKALQPVWQPSNPEWGNIPTVDFQAAHILSSSTRIGLKTFSFIALVQSKNAGILYEHTPNQNSFSSGSYLYTSTNATIFVKRNNVQSGKDNAFGTTWGASNSWPTTWVQQFGGTHASHRLFVRNIDERMSDVNTSDPGSIVDAYEFMYFGARGNAQPVVTPALQWSGSIAAMAIYSPALRVDQIFKVMRYFSQKFNVGM